MAITRYAAAVIVTTPTALAVGVAFTSLTQGGITVIRDTAHAITLGTLAGFSLCSRVALLLATQLCLAGRIAIPIHVAAPFRIATLLDVAALFRVAPILLGAFGALPCLPLHGIALLRTFARLSLHGITLLGAFACLTLHVFALPGLLTGLLLPHL